MASWRSHKPPFLVRLRVPLPNSFQSSQAVRQRTVNAPIVGSIPTSGASHSEVAEWSKATGCNPVQPWVRIPPSLPVSRPDPVHDRPGIVNQPLARISLPTTQGNIMPTIKYRTKNNWVACQVLAKIDDKYQIRYWDDGLDQYQTLFVSYSELKFPTFGELQFC